MSSDDSPIGTRRSVSQAGSFMVMVTSVGAPGAMVGEGETVITPGPGVVPAANLSVVVVNWVRFIGVSPVLVTWARTVRVWDAESYSAEPSATSANTGALA